MGMIPSTVGHYMCPPSLKATPLIDSIQLTEIVIKGDSFSFIEAL